jgi:hypothetical protein
MKSLKSVAVVKKNPSSGKYSLAVVCKRLETGLKDITFDDYKEKECREKIKEFVLGEFEGITSYYINSVDFNDDIRDCCCCIRIHPDGDADEEILLMAMFSNTERVNLVAKMSLRNGKFYPLIDLY